MIELTSEHFLTNSELSKLYEYRPETGEFFWKVDRGPVKAGDKAGCLGELGYWQLRYKNKTIKGHHVAWVLTYGQMPDRDIDHKDRDRSNNRILNLRLATESENMYNAGTPSNNTSSVKGVTWNRRKSMWVARVSVKGDRRFLGYFKELEQASEAVATFRRLNHGEFAND